MRILRKSDTQRRRIAAVGMYDGVHAGHRFLIDFLRRRGHAAGLAPAVVTFGSHPKSVVSPGRAPATLGSLEERLALLERAGVEECIILDFNERLRRLSARDFLAALHDTFGVDALVMGFNNHFGSDRPDTFEAYRTLGTALGIDIVQAPEYGEADVSSSHIRNLLAEGDAKGAADALGRLYSVTGTVGHGRKEGRQLGFPTANVEPVDPRQALPKPGVYAAWATPPDGMRRPAVVNIGTCPTFNGEDERRLTLEVHILNYSGWIYDERLKVEFVARLRDEQPFSSPDALVKQIKKDIDSARKLLRS